MCARLGNNKPMGVALVVAMSFVVALGVAAAHGVGIALASDSAPGGQQDVAEGRRVSAVEFKHELDDYKPKKSQYNFHFTYKLVHPWWDAVALGMEDAQRQYLSRGVTITYEYLAPKEVSAEDQKQ